MKDLTKGNIYKTFFLFGLPLVLSGLLTQTYSVIDTAIAGRFLGEHALAAMGAVGPLNTFVNSVFWGYGVGFSVYLGGLFSAKKYDKIRESVYSNVVIMLAVCIMISLLSIVFHKPIFRLLKVDESLWDVAFAYFSIIMAGKLFLILNSAGVYIMNAFGISGFPFIMSVLSAVLNISGNVLSITVLKWGIKGIALSTVFAAVAVDICYVFKFQKCLKEMGAEKQGKIFSFYPIKKSLPYALPNMLQQGVMYFFSLGISPLVNGLGPSGSASYSVVSQVYSINTAVYHNSARCISCYAAQCVGKKEYGKIKKGILTGLIQNVAFTTPFILACVFFAEPICNIFLKADADLLTKEYAYMFAREYVPFLYIDLLCNLFHGLYRGTKATAALFSTTCLGAVSRFAYSFALMPSMQMRGFYLAWVLSWVTETVYTLIIYARGRWNPAWQELRGEKLRRQEQIGTRK
ncbi:MAG: polysaccharide biosynthesis C-terminal domain-containing protein [Clostridia bacterium]|nr:polysaccharide biosynthesis C-terminal domain-containing protein [Clostridia bacterium]